MLCLTLTGTTLDEDFSQYERNKAWIKLVELRIDLLDENELDRAASFPQRVDVPVILTCRRVSDGGKCDLQERQRLNLLKRVAAGDFSYVDIEDDVKKSDFEQELHARGVKIIRSFHDCEGMPADIYSRLSRMATKGDIPKIAVTPRTFMDVISLFRVEQELAEVPEKIVIGMGEMGVPTRILYKRTGSFMTFCSDGKSAGGAPGHLTPKVMSELYRADQIDKQTHIYGIIGNPVMHTASPMIHNPGFHAIQFNAVYVPFLVDSVRSFFKLAESMRIYGFSVTIPHKQDVLPYLGRITREVKQIGSCNTVVRIQNMWKGINTDYYGFLTPIQNDIEQGRIHSALVIGAGGASRAVVWALHNHNIKVTIVNRNVEKARALADETMGSYDSLDNVAAYRGQVDLVVQTTSVGMAPDVDGDPAPDFLFSGDEIVYDLVYKPHETKFLSRAKAAGCRVQYGMDMLVQQGKLQFEAFTGYHYPQWVHMYSEN
ncbi:MAG: shikimate dehydrogenase [Sphaerochaetaceae bacterium]|nr:shikimate dehydrogenase [Sphaerochaetaceae bacterium]